MFPHRARWIAAPCALPTARVGNDPATACLEILMGG
ncbi:hypothetical protein PSYJA_31886, partial [Pseudomonas syringae pv. japonica str. M301072]